MKNTEIQGNDLRLFILNTEARENLAVRTPFGLQLAVIEGSEFSVNDKAYINENTVSAIPLALLVMYLWDMRRDLLDEIMNFSEQVQRGSQQIKRDAEKRASRLEGADAK
jgi:hypothetical protein